MKSELTMALPVTSNKIAMLLESAATDYNGKLQWDSVSPICHPDVLDNANGWWHISTWCYESDRAVGTGYEDYFFFVNGIPTAHY